MADTETLIFAFRIDQNGATEIGWDELRANPRAAPGSRLWIHMNRLSVEAREWLVSSGLLSKLMCDVLFQEETRPRAFVHNDAVVLNLRGINHNEGAAPEDLLSLRMYADDTLMVTTRAQRLYAVEDLRKLLNAGHTPSTNGAMMTFLANRLTERFEPFTQRLEEQVDALEDDMLDQNTPPPKLAVANFRRAVLSLRRHIYPQREAISSLIREGGDFLSKDDRLILRETQDVVFRLSEQLDMVRERAVVLQEQIVELRGEAMNQRLFVLAIISAVFLPLGFVTGLFGVNVGGMPGVDSPLAFSILCGAMVMLVGVLFYLFKRMKWL